MKREEQNLQISVARYLEATLAPEVVFSAIGHGGGGRTRGAILKGMGVKAGLPDIMIWWQQRIVRGAWSGDESVCVGLELKSAHGRLSPAQSLMKNRLLRVSVEVFACRSVEDVQRVVSDLGIPSRDRYVKQARAA